MMAWHSNDGIQIGHNFPDIVFCLTHKLTECIIASNVYFFTAYKKLQQLHETGGNKGDWQMVSNLLGDSKAHLVIQVWQLVLADRIYSEENSS
jgi:hypothetical protein